eukprot:g40982.t1
MISKYVEDSIPKKSTQVFLNRKPWMSQEVHSLLNTRRAAFKSGDLDQDRKSRYDLRKTMRDAKRQRTSKLCNLGLASTLCKWILSDPQAIISENRNKKGQHAPIYIIRTEVEKVKSIKFLGVTITDNLPWTSHVDATVKKPQHRLFFLRQLRKFGIS